MRGVKSDLDIYIENPKGSKREWYDPHNGEQGSTYMHYAYGYVKGTLGTDGDEVDVYVGPQKESDRVFVVTQMKAPDFVEIDEQKCFVYFDTIEQVYEAYLNQYNDPRFLGSITEMSMADFKSKLKTTKGDLIKSLNRIYRSARIPHMRSILSEKSMNKSRNDAIDILKSVSENAEQLAKAEPKEPVEKALTSRAVNPMARRMRLHEYAADVAGEQPTIGTNRRGSEWEPPVVPVRTVTPEEGPARPYTVSKSCDVCSMIYKSTTECPRCARNRSITEAGHVRFRGN